MKLPPQTRPTRQSRRIARRSAINRLAPEILSSIIAQLDNESLQKARLVNRTWRSQASEHLFRTIAFLPTKDGMEKWNRISRHRFLRRLPRKAMVYSSPVPNFKICWNWGEPDSLSYNSAWRKEYSIMSDWHPDPRQMRYSNFYSAFGSLANLPNLQHAYLQFTANCITASDIDEDGVDYSNPEGSEAPDFRVGFLTRFFQALKTRDSKPGFAKVRQLTIKNLQNKPIPEFTSSELFKEVMQHVKHLNLSIAQVITAVNEQEELESPDIYMEERRTFIRHLEDQWLKPWSHLRSLALYSLELWGSFPARFGGQDLDFPYLEELRLDRYCLAHDDAIDWILRHRSIRTLGLQDCKIISYITLQKTDLESWNVTDHDWIPIPPNWSHMEDMEREPHDDSVNYYFPGTWEQALDRIRASLVNLVDFRLHFNISEPFNHDNPLFSDFDTPERQISHLSPGRYTGFDSADVYPWALIMENGCLMWGDEPEDLEWEEWENAKSEGREYSGTRVINRHIPTKDGDARALKELLKTVAERAKACA